MGLASASRALVISTWTSCWPARLVNYITVHRAMCILLISVNVADKKQNEYTVSKGLTQGLGNCLKKNPEKTKTVKSVMQYFFFWIFVQVLPAPL